MIYVCASWAPANVRSGVFVYPSWGDEKCDHSTTWAPSQEVIRVITPKVPINGLING